MRGLIDRTLEVLSGLEASLRRAPRRALVAAAGALVIVVVCVSLLIAQLQPGASSPVTHLATRIKATRTSTDTPTVTNTTAPTATRAPKPKPVPTTPPPPPVPTPPPATPTATPCPTFAPATPTATGTGSPTVSATATKAATCTTCPVYAGNNSDQSTLQDDLDKAADTFGLPRHLVEAVAWQESKWHEDVTSCDGGVGLMQIQWYYVSYFNSLSVPECNLSATSYDANLASGNALLGAKYLAYLACYWSYWGGQPNAGYSLSNPYPYTIAWYYQQARLPYPDTTHTPSLCQSVYDDPGNPEYPAMTSSIATPFPWPCPFSATAGDSTLLDVTVSAYNAGAGAIGQCGCIPNPGYVSNVEGFIPQFASGALPQPS